MSDKCPREGLGSLTKRRGRAFLNRTQTTTLKGWTVTVVCKPHLARLGLRRSRKRTCRKHQRQTGVPWKPRWRSELPSKKKQKASQKCRIRNLQSSVVGVLIWKLSGKRCGEKKQEEGRWILVIIQAHGDKSLISASEMMGWWQGSGYRDNKNMSAGRVGGPTPTPTPPSYSSISRRVLLVWVVDWFS